MKLLKRSMIVAVTVAGLLTGAVPASAIVGGHDASQLYPGMVHLAVTHPGLGVASCGGELIHPKWVLTAAHCVSDHIVAPVVQLVPATGITVRVGSNDRTSGGQFATGAKLYLHPDWAWEPTGRPAPYRTWRCWSCPSRCSRG